MLKNSDYRNIVIIAVALTAMIALTPLGLRIYNIKKFNYYTDRIEKAIEQMAQKWPQQVKRETWDEACNWLLTANANICFSPEHVPMDKVILLSEKFESKVAGPVNLGTVEWMWDEFAAASPYGAEYADWYRAVYLEYLKRDQPDLLTDTMRGNLNVARAAWQANAQSNP